MTIATVIALVGGEYVAGAMLMTIILIAVHPRSEQRPGESVDQSADWRLPPHGNGQDDPDVTIYEGGGINNGWVDYRDRHLGPELKGFENLQFGHSKWKKFVC